MFAGVDVGNTSVKVKVYGEGIGKETFVVSSIEDAVNITKEKGVGEVMYCTTRKLTPTEENTVRAECWEVLDRMGKLNVELQYATPETLGADRIALAVAARKRCPANTVVVADLGTALTLDIVTADGKFVGGNISAGLNMRLKSLHEKTSLLPLVEEGVHVGPIGVDTATALQAGAHWGVCWEIAGFARMAKRVCGADRLLLTGGGAQAVAEDLRKELVGVVDMEEVPSLVTDGLIEVYRMKHEI